MFGACVLVEVQALVQNLGQPTGLKSPDDYADAFAESIFEHFSRGATKVDVIYKSLTDLYILWLQFH